MIVFGRHVSADEYPHLTDAGLLSAIRDTRTQAHATGSDQLWSRLHALTASAQARRLDPSGK
ncbi:MAG: hypothetical protein WCJ64_00585 [Rhodospirillaceae bacterium]